MLSTTFITIITKVIFLTTALGAVPPPGFAQANLAVGNDSSEANTDQVPVVNNSTAAPQTNTTGTVQLNPLPAPGGGILPSLPGFPLPSLPGSGLFPPKPPSSNGSGIGIPPHFSNPLPTVTPSVNQSCLARFSSLMVTAESEGQPRAIERVSCFNPYTKIPDGENLVVASVDAATNITESISTLIQDVSGKKILAAVPIIIADLRTLTAVVATGVAHIAVATSKGVFTSSSLVYVLEGFVAAGQSITEGLIGQKGFFAQFQVLTPLRNALLSLKSVIDKFVLLLIHMIPTNRAAMAMSLQRRLDNSMNKAIQAFDENAL